MNTIVWRVDLSGPSPDLTEHQLRWLRDRALAEGLRIEVSKSQIRATFSVSASDCDAAIDRARLRWETAQAVLRLPRFSLCHFAVDQVAPPRDTASSVVRNRPRPRPLTGVARLDIPTGGSLDFDRPGDRRADRATAQILAIR